MAETLNTRVTRLETAMATLTEKTNIMADKMNALIDAQIRHDAELAELRKEANERERRMDERIGQMVSAIGEMIRRPQS